MRYLLLIFIIGCSPKNENTAGTIIIDSISNETMGLRDSLTASIEALDSLKPIIQQTIAKIRYYEDLKQSYENEIKPLTVYKKAKNNDDSINILKIKLAFANSEIASLKNELARLSKKPSQEERLTAASTQKEIPDDDAVIVELSGKSKEGDIPIPDNLSVYLIPYTKKVKKLMIYETSCDESELRRFAGYRVSKYYNGVYFFNDVEPGKYLIKVCCYYGNFKLIDKYTGTQSITMQISPPLQ